MIVYVHTTFNDIHFESDVCHMWNSLCGESPCRFRSTYLVYILGLKDVNDPIDKTNGHGDSWLVDPCGQIVISNSFCFFFSICKFDVKY